LKGDGEGEGIAGKRKKGRTGQEGKTRQEKEEEDRGENTREEWEGGGRRKE